MYTLVQSYIRKYHDFVAVILLWWYKMSSDAKGAGIALCYSVTVFFILMNVEFHCTVLHH